MNYRIRWIISGSIYIISIIGLVSIASADDALVKKFLEEAPKKWREYESLMRGFEVQGDYITEVFIKELEKKVKNGGHETDRTIFSSDTTQAIYEQDNDIFGSNKDYTFHLKKSRAAKNPLSILDVSPLNPKKPSQALRLAAGQAGSIWNFWPLDFLKIVSLSDFKVQEATETVRDGQRLVSIKFEYRRTNPKPKEIKLANFYSGTVLFAPDSYWAIIESQINLDKSSPDVGSYHIENQLENTFKRLPVVVKSKYRIFDNKGKLAKSVVSEFKWKQLEDDNKAFTLSAFGFPEP